MTRRLLFLLLHPLWRLFDRLMPKRPDFWAFATHHLHSERFIENQRALFEHIKGDDSVRKLVFHRGRETDFEVEGAVNYDVVRHGSLRGLLLLARCKVVFLTHSISMDFSLRWPDGSFDILALSARGRVIVNLWHGIPLKRLLYAANEAAFRHTDRIAYRTRERRGYAGLIASSDIDSYAMAAMFYPLNYRQVWVTGLPRNDFLTLDEDCLPRYVRDSLHVVRTLRGDRRLIVYAPTYRQTAISPGARYYQFSDAEITQLRAFLRENRAVLGYRPHYFRNSSEYFNLGQHVDGEWIIDVSQERVPEFSALARECDVLVTDYSSVYIEALYLGKPVVCFGYDIEHYMAHEDGLLYDLRLAFPGPVVERFDALLPAIATRLGMGVDEIEREQETARKLFFKHHDTDNSSRVAQRVRSCLAESRK
ncbi:CDP-glycerol glycerophosphotransferase family protein [Pseudazoarcus pumilus]|uniref:Teichoic acid biosynthesis protein B n=1 Tax=Pseudazoarcus pumilus TaxID=2067960 RepID=A0A2I6S8C4_9RHOO|nr:CDP-glycerol glycerophosphotransferase family protein [Pseudazoarcus pumilus]AUN95519.1 teichoic acid biosynthesis protein B [Pseudazoarcus pumilus]